MACSRPPEPTTRIESLDVSAIIESTFPESFSEVKAVLVKSCGFLGTEAAQVCFVAFKKVVEPRRHHAGGLSGHSKFH